MSKLSIHWFRNDLRVNDNPSLHFAAQNGSVMPIFINDTVNTTQEEFKLGEASAWWLHHSLHSLNESLNGALNFYSGNPIDIISKLIAEHDIESFSWNRAYSPWEIKRDTAIKALLKANNINVKTFKLIRSKIRQSERTDGSFVRYRFFIYLVHISVTI